MTNYTEEERKRAAGQICVGGKEAGIAFFERHPRLGFTAAIDLQCELNRAIELLKRVIGNPAAAIAEPDLDAARDFLARW